MSTNEWNIMAQVGLMVLGCMAATFAAGYMALWTLNRRYVRKLNQELARLNHTEDGHGLERD